MKITQVDLKTDSDVLICEMSYKDPKRLNKYNIKAIVGLDVDEIMSSFYGRSATAKKFYSSILPRRDLVIRMKLNPSFSTGETYADLRDNIYRNIAAGRTGKIIASFINGVTEIAAISGFVTKVEATIFDQEPEVQITVKCDDPMLRSRTRTVVDVSGLDETDTTVTDSSSTAPHGAVFAVEFLSDQGAFTLSAFDDEWEFEVDAKTIFLTGDILYISSEYDNFYCYRDRSGTISQHADRITFESVWPILFPGDNRLKCSAGVEWHEISYLPTYWGV